MATLAPATPTATLTSESFRPNRFLPGGWWSAPAPRPGCSGRRNCNVNLDELRGDRPDLDCEPQQAGGIPRNLQLDETVRVKTLGDIAGRESGGLIVLLVAVGALTLASPEFLTGNNLANLARQVAIFGILAIGQLMVILTGGIDLSVGSILGLAGAVTAQLLVSGVPMIPAIVIGVLVGGVLGVANGVLVTRFKLPPFIATLGMLGIARGIVLVITDANTIQGLPDSFQTVANGNVVEIPNLLIIFVVITAAAWFVLNRTVFGRYVYAVGSNPRQPGSPVSQWPWSPRRCT